MCQSINSCALSDQVVSLLKLGKVLLSFGDTMGGTGGQDGGAVDSVITGIRSG